MVYITVNGPKTEIGFEGPLDRIVAEVVCGISAAYASLKDEDPETASVLKTLLTMEVLNGGLFEDHDTKRRRHKHDRSL